MMYRQGSVNMGRQSPNSHTVAKESLRSVSCGTRLLIFSTGTSRQRFQGRESNGTGVTTGPDTT